MVFSPAQPPSKATGKPQARQACMATPIAKRKTREPTTATPAGGGSIAQLSSKLSAERKDRKKRKSRKQPTHTAETLHKLLHATPERVFETVRRDTEILIKCRDGKVRTGNKVTLLDCTPTGKPCHTCIRLKMMAAAQSKGKAVASACRPAKKVKLSKLIDRRQRQFNGVSLYTGTGHDITMYTLLKYRRGRVIAYDNTYGKEYIRKRWSKRLSARRLDEVLSRLTLVKRDLLTWDEKVLEQDIREAWGPDARLTSVTYLHASPSCRTLSTADRSRKHRHKDGSPKSADAKLDDQTCTHVLRVLRRIAIAAPRIIMSVENPYNKNFVNLRCVQDTIAAPGWSFHVTNYCKVASRAADPGDWPKKTTCLLLFNVEDDLMLPRCHNDCDHLVQGTVHHKAVLCNNHENVKGQTVTHKVMDKGVIPLGLFEIIDASGTRHTMRQAAVATLRSHTKSSAGRQPLGRPASEVAGGTRSWLRSQAAKQGRFERMVRNIGTSSAELPEVDDGSGPEESGDDADVHEEVESDGEEGADEPCELVHENQYDAIGMSIKPSEAPLPAPTRVYDVRGSKINPFLRWVPGAVANAPRWDLASMEPWSLSFWDEVDFAFKVKGKKQHALLGYDVVSGSCRVKQETSKRQHGSKFDEVVAEEGLHKRPHQVTVGTDGCGSMALLRAAALARGINHYYLPPWSPSDNPVEGIVNHFKTDTATVLLSACAVGGGITEAHVGYALEYVSWMRERFAHVRRGEHASWNPWHRQFGADSRLHRAVPFGAAGMAHVSPALRAKRGAPKYERTEPVLCLGYQHVYSDVYRCLTKHGTVIHTKQVVWDLEAPLGVWLSNDSEPSQHKVEESELYGSIGLELFKDKHGKARTEFGSANAILKAVPHRLHRSNNTIRPRPYIYARARERDGVSVQEALHSKYLNEVGLPVRYTVADLRYDLKCGWLALDVHADAREGEEDDDTTDDPSVAGPSTRGAHAAKRKGTSPKAAKRRTRASSRRGACSAQPPAASTIAMKDLSWKAWLDTAYKKDILESYRKEFAGLTSTVLEELPETHPDYARAVKFATNCRVILEYKRSGQWKSRCVVQGFREMCSLLDGEDFCYASDVAGLAAVRNLVFDPIAPGEDSVISSCDIAQAYLQSDMFPESDPPRFLKVRDPVSGLFRYFRQWGVLYGSRSSAVRWQRTLHPFLESIGFVQGQNEPCAFYHPGRKIKLLSYVDDLLLKASQASSDWFYEKLFARFECKPAQWLSCKTPLDHLGMTIFQDGEGTYISMEDYIRAMLVKLQMTDCASGRRIRTPMRKAIDDFTEVSREERAFFMSACGMIGWLASTGRPDLKHCHSRISQHMSAPGSGALDAVKYAVKYCATNSTLCLFQPYGSDGLWHHYSDSDQSSNAEPQNKRRSQLAGMSVRGRAPIDWSSTATSVQISDAVDRYEHTVAKATAAGVGSAEWKNAPRYARLGNPTCHTAVTELHADVSSAAAEIYAASVMLSRTLYLSYVSDELGIPFETPIKIQVDNQTALSFATGTVKKSKLRHIDARQDWVQALRDATLVKLAKVHTSDNLADLGTKLLEPDTFEGLRDRIMVNRPIPQSKLEQPNGAGSATQGATEDELSDAPTVSPSDTDSGSDSDAPAQAGAKVKRPPNAPAQASAKVKRPSTADKPSTPNQSTGAEEAKGNALPAPKGASARNAVPPGTKAADADASAGRRRRKGRSAPGPEAGQVP